MNWLEAFFLGLVQGLTEFLPVSSSGHLTILGTFFGLSGEENLAFTVLLHVATILSAVLVLRGEIGRLLKGLFAFRWNSETKLVTKLLISAVPVAIVGLLFKDEVEVFFGSGLLLVGCMLILTAVLLTVSGFAKPRPKEDISFRDALVIGLSQAIAVLPGLSRSGTTISTGIMLGNKKENVAVFSFLMVMIPVLGEALLSTLKLFKSPETSALAGVSAGSMIIGFITAFLTGAIACKWMIGIVKKGKLIYFAYYCVAVGLFAIIYSFLNGK